MCASLVPCLGTNARLGAAQGRDTKTGAQGGEKAHHLLHTGYKTGRTPRYTRRSTSTPSRSKPSGREKKKGAAVICRASFFRLECWTSLLLRWVVVM